jgi:hypothetical protein
MLSSIKRLTLVPLVLLGTAIAARAEQKTFINKTHGTCIVLYDSGESVNGHVVVAYLGPNETRKLEVDKAKPFQIQVIYMSMFLHNHRVVVFGDLNVKDIQKNIYTIDDKGLTASDH